MKQLLLTLTMLLCMGHAFGQTPAKLIEKYKALPGATYENTTQESLMSLDKEDSILSADEIAKLKKYFKKSEQVQIQNVREELLAEINKDIKALKSHELLFETSRNAGSESLGDSAHLIKQMLADFLNPTIKMQCYGKVDGKMVSDLLIRLDIWNTVALSYIDTKIDRDIWMKALEKSSFTANDNDENDDDDDDANIVDMKDVLIDVEKGDVLIVINGEEHPELHSIKEASEYMKKHHISFNNESWVVGEAVKEKYPKPDKKMVVEFSRNDKEQK